LELVVLVLLVLAQPAPALALPVADPLVGTVTDADGKPSAGVDVWLASGLPPCAERTRIGWAMWGSGAPDPITAPRPVLGHCLTDGEGRFRVELPADIVPSHEPLPVALWAYRAGSRVASRRLGWATPAPAEPIRLELRAGTAARLRIVGPDGAAVAGAQAVVKARDSLVVPDDVDGRLAAVTGADGIAVLQSFAGEEIRAVRVSAPKFGTQTITDIRREPAGPAVVKIVPTGRITGRVLAEAETPISGLKIQVQTFPEGFDTGGTVGSAEVVTDAAGRFEIPAIAAGRLALVLDFSSRPDLPYRGLPPAHQVVESGRTTSVQIRLKRVVRLRGLVRERGTGVPISGVRPLIPDPAGRAGGSDVVTDALGRFAGWMEGEQPYAFIYTTPKPYFVPADTPDRSHRLPARATEFTLPPAELVRGVTLRGTVVDETGQVLAGALVRASWGGSGTILQTVAVRTDSSGTFLLDGLDPRADLALTAQAEGLATAAPQSARADGVKEVKLTVGRSNSVVLAGRVLDRSGKPVPGAEVRIRSQTRGPEGRMWRIDPVDLGAGNALLTDAQGRFRTPHGIPRDGEYEASVRAAGISPGCTAWIKPGPGPAAAFNDLVLSRLAMVAGVVRDRQGRPVPGAIVFQSGDGPMRTRTSSDPQGRFELPGVIEGKAIVFAWKEGFRFHGQPADTAAGPAELVLARTDEPAAAVHTLESVLPRDEELALARRLLAPYVEKVMKSGTDIEKYRALVALAPIDPSHVLELIETHGAGKPQIALDALRSAVATAVAAQSPEEAVSVAATLKDADARNWCFLDICDHLPAAAHARRAELLAQVQLQANGSQQPAQKLLVLGRLADHWLDLDERDRALALLDQGRALAKDVPPPGYAVAMFAPALARVDLPGALALVDSTQQSARRADRVDRVFVFDRAYGEMAYRLAASDPGGAERALGLIVDPYRRGGFVAAACARMAVKDLPRARRLAESIDDPLHGAYALGLMARALAAADRNSATSLLDAAFVRLEEFRDDSRSYSSPANIAAVLLQAVEQIDPTRVQESVWRAAALRAPLLEERGVGASGRTAAELAMNLARYDRAAAAAVLARAVAGYDTADVDTSRQAFVAMALALVDPHRAVTLVESLPEDPGLDDMHPKNSARKRTAEILATHGDARWRTARQWGASLWTPAGSDL
jgi:hypothetical protein